MRFTGRFRIIASPSFDICFNICFNICLWLLGRRKRFLTPRFLLFGAFCVARIVQ